MVEIAIVGACFAYIAWKLYSKKVPHSDQKQNTWNKPAEDLPANYDKANKQQPSTQIKPTSPVLPIADVPHTKQTHLATENERQFYQILHSILSPDRYVIHSQVSLMALVQPVNYKDNSKTWAKRMDFVITDTSTKVLAVIELDDATHRWSTRRKRDKYVNEVLAGHHILLRFKAKRFYDSDEIAEILLKEAGIFSKIQ